MEVKKVSSSSEKSKATSALPNFLIAGAAKCGTTSLYHYLRHHPDIFMSPVKEPRFLSDRAANPGTGPGDDSIVQSGVRTIDDYLELFKENTGMKAIGEASADTLFLFERTIPAIQRYLGDPRIIIILRDPVDRAYSAYNYHVRDGREKLSFKDALIAEEQRKRDGYVYMWQYAEGGLYAQRVRAFQEQFSRVKVLLYDDFMRDAITLVQSVYAFLEVDPGFIPDMGHSHNVSGIPRWNVFNNLFIKPKRLHKVVRTIGGALLGADQWIRLRDGIRATNLQKPQPLDAEIERKLSAFYREDILKLQDYIGRDLSHWLRKDQI
jgi:hypothetical protein